MKILRSTAEILFGKILPRLPYSVIKGPLKGLKFILGSLSGKGGGGTVYFGLIEPMQTRSFVKTLKNGDILFDVGANVGYYTALGSKIVGSGGEVYSFEPLVRNISYLYRHVEINKLKNVNIIPCACSDSFAIVNFVQENNTAMGHIEDNKISDAYDMKITTVLSITLDEVASKLGIKPSVLKIDVEGAELAVLHGAESIISNFKPFIFLSVHSDLLRTECLNYLSKFGYSFEPLQEKLEIETAMEFLCTANN
jgi:FkbM family methyltransferase